MIDIQLLRIARIRADYNIIINSLDTKVLDTKTRDVLNAITQYYKQYPKSNSIDFSAFVPFMERNVYPSKTDDEREVYRNIVKNMAKAYPDEHIRAGFLESIYTLNMAHKVYKDIEDFNDGEDIDVVENIREHLAEYDKSTRMAKIPEVDENIDDILDNLGNDAGIKPRLKCLQEGMRPFRPGDFGILAARPDQGKTSLLVSEVSYMAPQLPEDRPVLWLNNEGPGYAIRPRLMCSALNCTSDELVQKKNAGTLYDEYYEAIGGKNKVRIVDVHGYNVGQIERLIKEINPGIIIIDMIDNVRGFSNDRRDLQLEALYTWFRDMATKYETITFAASQISEEGKNLQYPGQSCLKDSKTGKQGACEFIIMMGSQESEEQLYNVRWFSAPKNKLRKPGGAPIRAQVVFDRDRARYIEGDYTEDDET